PTTQPGYHPARFRGEANDLHPIAARIRRGGVAAVDLTAASSGTRILAEFFHYLLEHFPARTHHRIRQGGQGLVGYVEHIDEGRGLRVDVENPGQNFVAIMGFQEALRSEEHTSELQSPCNLVCRLLLEKKNTST